MPLTNFANEKPTSSSTSTTLTTTAPLLCERILLHFNRYQFFFEPPHLRHAKADRRFLQRVFREKAQSNVTSFYLIDCEEDALPNHFQELYESILMTEGSNVRAYQLILNSLTYFYSRRTWATSVQRCVIEFLENNVFKKFHGLNDQEIDEKPLFELELLCLLELFMVKYGSEMIDDEMIFNDLTKIHRKGGNAHLASFINGTVMNHFGCSLEHRLRRIIERFDMKMKAYRTDSITNNFSHKKKLTTTTLMASGRNGNNRGKRTSSSESTTHASSEEVEEEEKAEETTTSDEEEEEEEENDEIIEEEEEEEEEEQEEKTPTPPTPKRPRRGSMEGPSAKKRARNVRKDTSEESSSGSSASGVMAMVSSRRSPNPRASKMLAIESISHRRNPMIAGGRELRSNLRRSASNIQAKKQTIPSRARYSTNAVV